MIPLRDMNPTLRPPVVTWALIAAMVSVWLYQLADTTVIERFGVVPSALARGGGWREYSRLLTSIFVHAGWLHLLGNIWFLHVFGDNVEDTLGRGPYLAFFLSSGVAAAATQIAIDPSSPVTMVGASGAIAGILGAYLVLHPRARVLALVLVFFAELPAWVFLFVWFALQLLDGLLSLRGEETGGTAFFAHIGGFVAGVGMMLILRQSPETPAANRR